MEREKADLLLDRAIVVTMDDAFRVWESGAVAVRDGEIVAVGPSEAVRSQVEAAEVLDLSGHVVIPGLINAHTHVPMSLLRGLKDDEQLDVWLFGYMLPVEARFVDPEFSYWGTLLSAAELALSGVTTIADMYYYEEAVAQALDRAGLRGIAAQSILRLPAPDAPSYDEGLRRAEEFVQAWKDHPRIVPALGPHAPYTITEEIVQAVRDLALRYDVPVHIHLSETAREVEEHRAEYGTTPALWLEDLGLFEAKVIAAHSVHLTEEEMDLLARRGVGAVHNPTSNLKLASGIAPVVRMRQAGIAVGLGTDGPASNNNQNLMEEIHLAALLPKGVSGDPTALPAREALALATREGARALHLEDRIGSLEVGKRADLVVLDLSGVHLQPRYWLGTESIYATLVYAAQATDVRHVLVEGRFVVRDRQVLSFDVEEAVREAWKVARQVQQFFVAREESLLDKLLGVGPVEPQEIFEIQAKVRLDDPAKLDELLASPDVHVLRTSERNQYDTYMIFPQGWIRYREDHVHLPDGRVEPRYFLTLVEPSRKEEYPPVSIVSRSRYTAPADRSLRFYREYFRPPREVTVEKERRRAHIRFRGEHFALNLDRLLVPEQEGYFLEIKSRTWSRADAQRKAALIQELLARLGLTEEARVSQDYLELVG